MFLTDKELIGLTGYTYPSLQIKWLRANGFTFRIAADGHPRVDRSHYLKLMGGTSEAETRKKTEPDFSSLVKKAA